MDLSENQRIFTHGWQCKKGDGENGKTCSDDFSHPENDQKFKKNLSIGEKSTTLFTMSLDKHRRN